MGLAWSAHISWLFCELPYSERVAAARRAGFSRIETAWPERAADRDGLVRAVREHDMEVVLLNCPAGDTAGGERGFLNDPARREEAEQGLLAAADLAASLGATNLNVLVGRERASASASAQRSALVQTLQALAAEATARGLRLLIEPVNAIENPGYLAPTPGDVVALIEECGADGLGVLLDVYHVARAGGDPVAEIERCGALIGHVQLSDHPGRGRPGSGALDFPRILQALGAAGYEGALGLEYDPHGPTERSLERLWDERYPVAL